jgi:hypothetical protein
MIQSSLKWSISRIEAELKRRVPRTGHKNAKRRRKLRKQLKDTKVELLSHLLSHP